MECSKDRTICIGMLVFSAMIIIGMGIAFGFASIRDTTPTPTPTTTPTTTHTYTHTPTSTSTSTPAPTPTTTPSPTIPPTQAPAVHPGTGNGKYKNAAVATDSGKCSEIGRDILKKGGSAVDAAVAGSFCIGVVNMHSAGIGGGGFMLIYQKSKNFAEMLDFREEAPKMATEDMFQNISSLKGGKSTGIPGEIKGFNWAHKKYGKLQWKELVQPAINLARNGFPLPVPVYESLKLLSEEDKTNPGFKQLFFDGNVMKSIGDTVKNPLLAKTLETIRDDPDSFYTGRLADKVVRDIQSASGIITKEDLQNYKPKWKDALKSTLSDSLEYFTTTAPSSGPVLTMIINILKGYKMNKTDLATHNSSALTYHRIIEAFKYAYAWRSKLGDPDFNTTDTKPYTNINEVLKNMTSPSFAEQLRRKIEDDKTYHNPNHYGSNYDAGTGPEGTSHLSILAPNGDAVSVTNTINFRFGAKYRSLVTGIIYNNEMDDFSTPGKANGFGVMPSPSNFIKPGKRPMSSMSPVIFVRKGDRAVRLIAGASGGTRITTAVSLVAMNNLWLGMPIRKAVIFPRLHNQLSNTSYEVKDARYTMPKPILEGLSARGNYLVPSSYSSYSVVQAISREDQADIYAQSDPRKHGWAAGF